MEEHVAPLEKTRGGKFLSTGEVVELIIRPATWAPPPPQNKTQQAAALPQPPCARRGGCAGTAGCAGWGGCGARAGCARRFVELPGVDVWPGPASSSPMFFVSHGARALKTPCATQSLLSHHHVSPRACPIPRAEPYFNFEQFSGILETQRSGTRFASWRSRSRLISGRRGRGPTTPSCGCAQNPPVPLSSVRPARKPCRRWGLRFESS